MHLTGLDVVLFRERVFEWRFCPPLPDLLCSVWCAIQCDIVNHVSGSNRLLENMLLFKFLSLTRIHICISLWANTLAFESLNLSKSLIIPDVVIFMLYIESLRTNLRMCGEQITWKSSDNIDVVINGMLLIRISMENGMGKMCLKKKIYTAICLQSNFLEISS